MASIKGFVITLIALSVFLGVINMVIPKKSMAAPLKLISGLIMLITLLAPFTPLLNIMSFGTIDVPAVSRNFTTQSYEEAYQNQILKLSATGIKNDINEYFLDNYNKFPFSVEVEVYQDENQGYHIKHLSIILGSEFDSINVNENQIQKRYQPDELEIRRT